MPKMESYDELFSVRTDGCGNLLLFVNGEIVLQEKIDEAPWRDPDQATASTARQMVNTYLNGELMGL